MVVCKSGQIVARLAFSADGRVVGVSLWLWLWLWLSVSVPLYLDFAFESPPPVRALGLRDILFSLQLQLQLHPIATTKEPAIAT